MGRLQGGEIIIIINTWEHGSALQRTKGSPVYPGGHLQMARLPGGGHVSSITDQDQILGGASEMQSHQIWIKSQTGFYIADRCLVASCPSVRWSIESPN